MKLIIQSGIIEVIYEDNKYEGTESNVASMKMAKSAKIKLRKLWKKVKIS